MSTHDLEPARVLSPRRRDDLLERLAQVFLAQGFASLSVEDLALRCHVSPGTLLALAPDPEHLRRAVVEHWCHRTAAVAERRAADEPDLQRRPDAYLAGTAEALAPAGNAFFRDLDRSPSARHVYELTTRHVAERVRELLRDAVRDGRVRDVRASFVADTVLAMTDRISSGDLLRSTGLDDARAYAELAVLVQASVSS